MNHTRIALLFLCFITIGCGNGSDSSRGKIPPVTQPQAPTQQAPPTTCNDNDQCAGPLTKLTKSQVRVLTKKSAECQAKFEVVSLQKAYGAACLSSLLYELFQLGTDQYTSGEFIKFYEKLFDETGLLRKELL